MKHFLASLLALMIIPAALAAGQKFPSVTGDYFAIVKMNNKFGVMDKKGKILIPVEYDYDGYSPEGDYKVYRLMKDGKMGALFFRKNGASRFVLPAFEAVKDYGEGLCGVKLGGKWGFINENGEIVIEPQFEDIDRFGNGVAPVKLSDKFGIIDKRGKMVLAPKYDSLQSFVRGFSKAQNYRRGKEAFSALVDTHGREILRVDNGHVYETLYGTFCVDNGHAGHDRCSAYAGRDGRIIISMDKYPYVMQLSPDRFAYLNDKGKWEILDGKLNTVRIVNIETLSVWGTLFENLVVIRKNGKMGFMDVDGNIVTEPIFDCLGAGCPASMEEIYLAKKVIRVWRDGKVGLVNSRGKVILEPASGNVTYDEDGDVIAYEKNKKLGLLDNKGHVLTGPDFDLIYGFNKGVCEASLNGRSCLINTKGEILFGPTDKYEYRGVFNNGLIKVEKGDKAGAADKNGNIVVEIKYDSIENFYDGKARVLIKTKDKFKSGYVDAKGNPVIPIIYDEIVELAEKEDPLFL